MKLKRSRLQVQICGIIALVLLGAAGSYAQIQTPRISPITITSTVNGNTTTTIDPAPAAAAAAAAAAQAAENEALKATMAQQAAELERQKQALQSQQLQQGQLQRQEMLQQQMLMQQSGKPGAPGAPGQPRPTDGKGYTVIPEDQGFNAPAPTTTSTTLGDYSEFVSDVKKGKPTITKKKKSGAIMYAIFETSKGTFKAKLFESLAPKTVDNFVGLANGTKEWMDPKTNTMVHRPFFDGLTFHRVIPQFMIQGGDPVGNGTGGPGYQFDDEIVPTLHHNKAGILSMANAGPNTNGSQFFITVAPATYLDGKYNIFGEIVEGQKIVEEISKVKRNSHDLPNEPVIIKHVKIVEK